MRERNREFSITTHSHNRLLDDQAFVEAAVDDCNTVIEAIGRQLTGEEKADDHEIWFEPYKKTLAAAVDNHPTVVTDKDIDTMRERAAELVTIVLSGLQDRPSWFVYIYRLTNTRHDVDHGSCSLFMKKDQKILDISNDEFDRVERQVSKLVNRLLQIT